ncbi:MAG: terminase family protein [Ignavibacteriales bacterium]|nr:MAG: hypothetical protein F9K26_05410 [Ignavibacteriaceae bacterium]MBW7872854.1 hypothetical protein [Ignavibacteria bacterium]MCZ2143574.1 terminase family protein [Ignavibacteriales bacterium]OQY73330.1 MAG: hypothetical protein B6D45_08290 [Ignavibacteriales bacterium UTCHB3]MBZ0197254.1 terminase family protein [Ignavibacteriaceae bacterium]
MTKIKKQSAESGNKQPPYFLPYQVEWLKNRDRVKIWEKSRRIGATYVQAYEDVEDCITKKVPSVWFSSADESAAREYIYYCAMWAKLFQVVAQDAGEEALDGEKDIKVFFIQFANGTRINALSSNPKAFRSKGGKVILDEFAFHKNARELWSAAKPATTWGFPLRILSTHNGKNCLYYEFVHAAKRNGWWKQTTTIQTAVSQGLADKILGRSLSDKERLEWIDQEEKNCSDIHTWNQEYCCIAIDETTAFLPYDLIAACENESCGHSLSATPETIAQLTNKSDSLFIGMDIGRKKDLSVIWVGQDVAGFIITLGVWVMERTPFHIQKSLLFSLLNLPQVRRVCIDETGIGIQIAEEARFAFGSKVEPVWFTGRAKEEIAFQLLRKFEDRHIAIPANDDIRNDLHSIQKITTAAGNIRFDQAAGNNVVGHADRFWALGLMVHAACSTPAAFFPITGKKRESKQLLKGYFNG